MKQLFSNPPSFNNPNHGPFYGLLFVIGMLSVAGLLIYSLFN